MRVALNRLWNGDNARYVEVKPLEWSENQDTTNEKMGGKMRNGIE